MSRFWFPLGASSVFSPASSRAVSDVSSSRGVSAGGSSIKALGVFPSPSGRWRRSLDTLLTSAFARRSEVADPWAQSTRPWEPRPDAAHPYDLTEARTAYREALRDVSAGQIADVAPGLSVDLQLATRRTELWALRSTLFLVVARQFSQSEAQRRLAALDKRFPPPPSASRPLASSTQGPNSKQRPAPQRVTRHA